MDKDNILTILSIVNGCLLLISEILPFVKTIKCNGILQCFFDNFKSDETCVSDISTPVTPNTRHV